MYTLVNAEGYKSVLQAPAGSFPNGDDGYIIGTFTRPGSDERVKLFVTAMNVLENTVAVVRVRQDIVSLISRNFLGAHYEATLLTYTM